MTYSASRPEAEKIEGLFGGQISKESVSQQAYLAIRDSLMRSRLRPGQKLVAREVARELGISVTPVRESLLRLVSEHGLTIDERGTVMVPALNLDRCIEIRDLRTLLEGEGAARAAGTATKPEIDQLAAIHSRYMAAEREENFVAALAENENFHFTLCRLARSPVLFRVVENLWMQFGPVLAYLYDGPRRPFRNEKHAHEHVIDALAQRSPELARAGITKDIIVGGKTLIERLQS